MAQKVKQKEVFLGQLGSIDFYAKINADNKDVFNEREKYAEKIFGEMAYELSTRRTIDKPVK